MQLGIVVLAVLFDQIPPDFVQHDSTKGTHTVRGGAVIIGSISI
jgi:hypothetical protein